MRSLRAARRPRGSLAQGAGAWAVRGLAPVRRAFAAVWGTAELIVSMDALIIWRRAARGLACGAAILCVTIVKDLGNPEYGSQDL